jgi:hypothetical protein
MKRALILLFGLSFLYSCNNNKIPDVSNIQINLTTRRFEKDFFSLDSTHFAPGLNQLIAKYPTFGENFLTTILNVDPKWPEDSTNAYVLNFQKSYKAVYDSSSKVFADFSPYEKEIRQGLQFVKYYFPEYKAPQKIITYIGPVDGFGDIITDDAIIVGLHGHLGKNYSLYKTEMVLETYPEYLTDRFEPGYISVNAMKNIVLDIFPEKLEDRPLVQQMVEKGKRLYALSKVLPYMAENKLIGYTEQQMKDCYDHEKVIWDLFIQNNFLQTIDNNIIKNYIGEGPKTQELGDASPGNIGSFAGWQIVKKYMDRNPKTNLKELMLLDNETVFEGAKYSPN